MDTHRMARFYSCLFVAGTRIRRLPQLDLIAIGIIDPCETAVIMILSLRIETNALRGQLRENRVQIVHDVVDHEGGGAGIEVIRFPREHTPDSEVLGLR